MENFKVKTGEEQEADIQSVQDKVERKIIPEVDKNSSFESLAEKYPARYKHFVEVLRSLRNPEYKPEQAERSVKMIKMLDNLEDQMLRTEAGLDKTLSSRQNETLSRIVGFLEQGNTEGHVAHPTGVGKTVVFSKLLEAVTKGSGIKALVIGPTKIILKQNRWKLDEFGEIEAGAYYGSEKDLSKTVTVTTYASLRNGIANKDINPREFDMLILDEAHRALGPDTVDAIDSFSQDVIKIGFTATPEFHEEKAVADILPITIDEMKVREAIEKNLLAGLKVFLISTKEDISGVERKGSEYDEVSLAKIINTPERNQLVVNVYKDNSRFNGRLAIVYCGGRDHAKAMTSAFNASNIKAEYVDGKTSDDEREDIFSKYKRGEIKVLCNAEVLIEGFDEPEAEVCINAVPTLSKVVAEQRGGRVLRRSKVKNSKMGDIIEIVDEVGIGENTQVLYSEIAGAAEIMSPELKKIREKEDAPHKERKAKEKKKVDVTNDIVDDPDLIMQLTNKNMRQRYDKIFEYAPKEWTHSRRLAHELGVREGTIREFAEGQRVAHPEWFKKYLTSTDILTVHYSPEWSHQIRRHFNPELADTITKEEYGNEFALKDERAGELLSAMEENTPQKAHHFGDTAYYPKEEYERGLGNFEKRVRAEDAIVAMKAEERFWEDDDRTDEEREREYWDNFEAIQTPKKDLPSEDDITEDSATIPFNDEEHQSEGGPLVGPLLKNSLDQVLDLLEKREKLILIARFFEDKTLGEIAFEYMITPERIRSIEAKALRKLRHPEHIQFLDNPFISDKEVEEGQLRREKILEQKRIEALPIDEIIQKYIRFHQKILNVDRGEERIASWEKKYYDALRVFEYSLLLSDRGLLQDYLHFRGNKEQLKEQLKEIKGQVDSMAKRSGLKSILEMSPVLLPKMSTDGKMLKLYNIYTIDSTIRLAEMSIEYIRKQIGYVRDNRYYSNPDDEIAKLELELQSKRREVNEWMEYKGKYIQHFTKQESHWFD